MIDTSVNSDVFLLPTCDQIAQNPFLNQVKKAVLVFLPCIISGLHIQGTCKSKLHSSLC